MTQLELLRALRLHHWKGVLRNSAKIRRAERQIKAGAGAKTFKILEVAKKQHALHMTFVQLLNDYFPIGDTAERDNNATNL